MNSKAALWLALCAVLVVVLVVPSAAWTAAPSADSKLPPAAKVVPAGFTVTGDQDLGATRVIEGTKPNVDVPKPHSDPGLTARCIWMSNPAAAQIVGMIEQQPEEPAAQSPGSATREEPAGKSTYRDGVLTWRKVITPWIGSGHGPDLVTFRGAWIKALAGGYVTLEVDHFVGTKEGALALLDEMIGNVTGTDAASADTGKVAPARPATPARAPATTVKPATTARTAPKKAR
jgi:hypothetical protein